MIICQSFSLLSRPFNVRVPVVANTFSVRMEPMNYNGRNKIAHSFNVELVTVPLARFVRVK
jgi:hypothetical protein